MVKLMELSLWLRWQQKLENINNNNFLEIFFFIRPMASFKVGDPSVEQVPVVMAARKRGPGKSGQASMGGWMGGKMPSNGGNMGTDLPLLPFILILRTRSVLKLECQILCQDQYKYWARRS